MRNYSNNSPEAVRAQLDEVDQRQQEQIDVLIEELNQEKKIRLRVSIVSIVLATASLLISIYNVMH